MKWIFALNQNAPHFESYMQLAQVAVYTSRRCGGLEPILLYYGRDDTRLDPLIRLGTKVIYRASFLLDELAKLGERTGNENVMWYGPGVFLRAEIPALAFELGWPEKYILYTDCDIFFTERFEVGRMPRPASYFAVAPEGDQRNELLFNSGVMLMNVPMLQQVDKQFREQLVRDLPESVVADWDQFSYRRFFQGRHDVLPPKYNWKPYWGASDAACIIHFHGPKPFSRAVLRAGVAPAPHVALATDEFWHLCDLWDKKLIAANRAVFAR